VAEAAVVYATRTGNSRALAEHIALALGTRAFRIEDRVPRSGLWGYVRAGFQASTKKASPIGDPGVDLRTADRVVIVQPIWASSVVPPIRTWLLAHASELVGKRIGLFTVSKGGDPELVRKAFESEFMRPDVFGHVMESDTQAVKEAACARFAEEISGGR